MDLFLYNSLTRRTETFTPLVPGTATMYTCGPTVYNYAHIGNFRAYVFEDLLHRVLLLKGFKVRQIMNLTDIDDKTIRGSLAEGVSLDTFTEKYKTAFFEDIRTLNITPCERYPAATDHIPEMVGIIQSLLGSGHAYEKDGSVYFRIESRPDYGKLAHLDREGLQTGASGRVDADEYDKESASDFVLWKGWSEKDGPVFWETPLGKGRPGWHIECSAMSMKYLGETIDIHTGGIDNMFPHHENEIAQSESATGKAFVRHWLHCAYLVVDNEKMSKSKGNFFTLRDLLARGYDPAAIRYLLLSTHYRKMLNFSEQGLAAAAASLKRLNTFIEELQDQAGGTGETATAAGEALAVMREGFEAALCDDLNIAEALAAVFTAIKTIRECYPLSRQEAEEALAALRMVDSVLGVLRFEREGADEEIETLIEARNAARAARNFTESDRIRDELAARGILLKDSPQGTSWERAAAGNRNP